MAATREYELVLMLDPGQDAAGRDAVANEAKSKIEADGMLKHENKWGLRKLAYEIGQRNEADYRWFRFEAPPALLEQLDHSLKIADGVLRFRIFKVDATTPIMVPPPTSAPGPAASRERAGEERGEPAVSVAAELAVPATATQAPTEPADQPPAPPSESAEDGTSGEGPGE